MAAARQPAWRPALPPLVRRDGLPAAARGLAVGAARADRSTRCCSSLSVVALVLIPVAGLGFAAFPVITAVVRWRADLTRRLAACVGRADRAAVPADAAGRAVRDLAPVPARRQRPGDVAGLRLAPARGDRRRACAACWPGSCPCTGWRASCSCRWCSTSPSTGGATACSGRWTTCSRRCCRSRRGWCSWPSGWPAPAG